MERIGNQSTFQGKGKVRRRETQKKMEAKKTKKTDPNAPFFNFHGAMLIRALRTSIVSILHHKRGTLFIHSPCSNKLVRARGKESLDLAEQLLRNGGLHRAEKESFREFEKMG